MKKQFSLALMLGGLLLAVSGTTHAEDLYRAVIDFDPPKIFGGMANRKGSVLSSLMNETKTLCRISPKARGRYVKIGGGGEIPFDCESVNANKTNVPASGKQEKSSKVFVTHTQNEKGEWGKSEYDTLEMAKNYMNRACMTYRHNRAVKIVDPSGNETVRDCAEWRAANPGM
ncbi:hypothetical protein [Stenotrophomonas maltophilia]|uniref:hypothetical protein n=1 Tax=Stenotrophomonas maltophilia TaxID=40324 RepID=UPI003BF83919